ncbi:MAG TPA: DUF6252 family protein [Cyclobacteriaceae bacterium]|nr:DUF6252 family protein [Cyclobacteriaceae bacterium]
MFKLNPVIIVFFFFLLISCSEDKQPDKPVFPTKSDLEGYWKLTKIMQSGTAISFDDYQSPSNSARGIDNQYYYFNSTGEFLETTELSISVIIWDGLWEVLEDKLTASYSLGGSSKFKVISFNQNEITLTNQFALEYNLVFTRIEKGDFPETLMSATVDGQAFEATSNQAYRENGGYIQITGNNIQSDWMSITINNPSTLVAGTNYVIGDGVIFALYRKGTDEFGAYDGQLKIEKIRTDYIDVTFSFKAKTLSGTEVNIIDGKFKAIIKDNP